MGKRVTPECRISYPNLTQPRAFGANEPKYSCTMMFNEGDPFIKEVQAEITTALKEKFGQVPKSYTSPLKNGSLGENDQFKGYWTLSASNKTQPGIVNKDLTPIIDPSEIYPGMWGRCSISFWAWEFQGKKGVSVNLLNFMKTKNDSSFGRVAPAPEDDFKDYINQTEDLLEE